MSDLATVQKDIMRKAIASMVFAAETLEGCANPGELVERAMHAQQPDAMRAVSKVAEMLSNASLKLRLKQTSPVASPATTKILVTSEKQQITELELPYETFAQFACECDGAPLTRAQYVLPAEMYDASSYRRRVEQKDPAAPKWADFKVAQQAALAAKGVCFDKEDFFNKATMVTSQKSKSSLWHKYKTCCALLMGLRMSKHVTHVVGEKRPAPSSKAPQKKAGLSAKASEALGKVRPAESSEESGSSDEEPVKKHGKKVLASKAMRFEEEEESSNDEDEPPKKKKPAAAAKAVAEEASSSEEDEPPKKKKVVAEELSSDEEATKKKAKKPVAAKVAVAEESSSDEEPPKKKAKKPVAAKVVARKEAASSDDDGEMPIKKKVATKAVKPSGGDVPSKKVSDKEAASSDDDGEMPIKKKVAAKAVKPSGGDVPSKKVSDKEEPPKTAEEPPKTAEEPPKTADTKMGDEKPAEESSEDESSEDDE
jgi:hypothetical protein